MMIDKVKIVDEAARELDPIIITLNGDDAMELCTASIFFMAKGNDELVTETFQMIAKLVAAGTPCEQAVKKVLEVIAKAGRKVPPFLTPVLIHILSKVVQVTDRYVPQKPE